MKLTIGMVIYILLLVTKVDCEMKKKSPTIHSSRVSADGWKTSSCAVVEEGVPICRYSREISTKDLWSAVARTPYPQNGLDAASDWWEPAVQGHRAAGNLWTWWWYGGARPERNRLQPDERETPPSQPETIVTYSLMGCSPTKVPFNLSPCSARRDAHGQGLDHEGRVVSSTRVVYYVPPPPPPTAQQQPSAPPPRPPIAMPRPSPRDSGRTGP